MHRLKRKLYNFKLWRSQTWNRGHKAGYELCLSHYPREQAWIKRLEGYYYSHVNECLKTKCSICKEK